MNLSRLRYHPFPVDAWFDSSCALTYAIPAEEIAARLPVGLVPDIYEHEGNQWGFLTVAVVQTRHLRPSFFPQWLGHDFILLGYRFFVRCRTHSGRNLRGLCILRSETDQARMARLGNFFTHYHYVKSALRWHMEDSRLLLRDEDSDLRIHVDLATDPPPSLPDGSPFPDWKTARRFCGPMPFTFSVDSARHEVTIIEGQRSHWKTAPVRVLEHRIPWLDTFGFSRIILANAFVVRDIPYRWKRGHTEPLPPQP